MTDAEVQKKLDLMVRVSRELSAEADRRWPEGEGRGLYAEADGGLYLMAFDTSGPPAERQTGIAFTAKGNHKIGGGGW